MSKEFERAERRAKTAFREALGEAVCGTLSTQEDGSGQVPAEYVIDRLLMYVVDTIEELDDVDAARALQEETRALSRKCTRAFEAE